MLILFVQLRRISVAEGNAEQVIKKFSGKGMIEEQEGFIDLIIMEKQVRKGDEEVIVMIRWESEEYWKQWEKSEAHIANHKANLGKPKPEFILNTEVGKYEVKAIKNTAN